MDTTGGTATVEINLPPTQATLDQIRADVACLIERLEDIEARLARLASR